MLQRNRLDLHRYGAQNFVQQVWIKLFWCEGTTGKWETWLMASTLSSANMRGWLSNCSAWICLLEKPQKCSNAFDLSMHFLKTKRLQLYLHRYPHHVPLGRWYSFNRTLRNFLLIDEGLQKRRSDDEGNLNLGNCWFLFCFWIFFFLWCENSSVYLCASGSWSLLRETHLLEILNLMVLASSFSAKSSFSLKLSIFSWETLAQLYACHTGNLLIFGTVRLVERKSKQYAHISNLLSRFSDRLQFSTTDVLIRHLSQKNIYHLCCSYSESDCLQNGLKKCENPSSFVDKSYSAPHSKNPNGIGPFAVFVYLWKEEEIYCRIEKVSIIFYFSLFTSLFIQEIHRLLSTLGFANWAPQSNPVICICLSLFVIMSVWN